MVRIETLEGAVRFTVYARPRASRTEVAGTHGEAVKIKIAAPPVEGAANTELVSFLAKRLGVPKSAVRVVKGERGRQKLVEVEGVRADHVEARLG